MPKWKPEDWDKFSKGYQEHAGLAPPTPTDPASGDDSGWMGSIGAGFKGAAREALGDKTSDPQHSTAEWVGRQATDWAPLVALDALGPEVPMAGAALRYAPKLATLAQKGMTGAYKGLIGGAYMQPQDKPRGGTTGAETGAVTGMTKAGWSMLPGWAKGAAFAVPGSLASIATLIHEMGGGGRYISPWAAHHLLSALGGLAGAAAAGPATTGAAASKIQNYLNPEQKQQ